MELEFVSGTEGESFQWCPCFFASFQSSLCTKNTRSILESAVECLRPAFRLCDTLQPLHFAYCDCTVLKIGTQVEFESPVKRSKK